jgi:hypothetical protein
VIAVPGAHGFEAPLEQVTRLRRAEEWTPMMTTESDEMKTAGLVISNHAWGHANILHPRFRKRLKV